ncbi:hypothetical protein KQX54_003902 [Cotesia glomerata]|uniref:Uncharacterized protein n=1 Tax=Cotesia glomerata TaxID=32391 RepID=A0AAV7I7Y2_COTGL|nr:hypothetical protein KQX54_003902 [Cotesia glomerata]
MRGYVVRLCDTEPFPQCLNTGECWLLLMLYPDNPYCVVERSKVSNFDLNNAHLHGNINITSEVKLLKGKPARLTEDATENRNKREKKAHRKRSAGNHYRWRCKGVNSRDRNDNNDTGKKYPTGITLRSTRDQHHEINLMYGVKCSKRPAIALVIYVTSFVLWFESSRPRVSLESAEEQRPSKKLLLKASPGFTL